jgi:hypothetical protein
VLSAVTTLSVDSRCTIAAVCDEIGAGVRLCFSAFCSTFATSCAC